LNRKAITKCLTRAASLWLVKQHHAVYQEVGVLAWGKRRADLFGLSNDGSVFTIIEVKSCKQDFQSDKKWRGYLEHCNRFYFMVLDTNTWILEFTDSLKQEGAGVIMLCTDPTSKNLGYARVKLRASGRIVKKREKFKLLAHLAWLGAPVNRKTTRRVRVTLPK